MPNATLILKFLAAHFPRYFCVPCLALTMMTDESEVAPAVAKYVKDGTIETRTDGEPCVNCARPVFVVRVKENWRPL